MSGGIAEIKFGVPENLKKQASKYMDSNVSDIVDRFYQKVR